MAVCEKLPVQTQWNADIKKYSQILNTQKQVVMQWNEHSAQQFFISMDSQYDSNTLISSQWTFLISGLWSTVLTEGLFWTHSGDTCSRLVTCLPCECSNSKPLNILTASVHVRESINQVSQNNVYSYMCHEWSASYVIITCVHSLNDGLMTGICHYNLNAHSVNLYENELKTQMLMSQLGILHGSLHLRNLKRSTLLSHLGLFFLSTWLWQHFNPKLYYRRQISEKGWTTNCL